MSLRLKLRTLFKRRNVEQELDEEIRYHVERQVEANIAQGMSAEEARRAAMRAFGGVEQRKEESRDTRGLNTLDNLVKDLRYATRRLTQNPVFAIAAILTIALGIGVNTALFSVYNAIALRPLPVAQPDEVVRFKRWFQGGYSGDQQYRFSYDEYVYLRDHSDAFMGIVASSMVSPIVGDSGKFQVEMVSANYFDVLGIRAQFGRTFLADDRMALANQVVVLSHPFWVRQFNADPLILGKTLRTKNAVFTVIGVAPESFTGTTLTPIVPDLWGVLETQDLRHSDWLNGPDDSKLYLLARLKSTSVLAAAQSQVDTLLHEFPRAKPEPDKTTALTIEHTALFGNVDDSAFRVGAAAAMLVVGLVLLVACANLANVMLAQGAARQREIGIRLALGAGRRRIVSQLMTENFLLALLGSVTGLAISTWTSQFLWNRITATIASPFIGGLTVKLDLTPDIRVFGYALLMSVVATVLFGLVPALQITRRESLGFFGQHVRRSRMRSIFIAAQITVSMLFLLVGGLLMRGLLRAQNVDPGFETRTVFPLSTDFGRGPEAVTRQHRVIDRLRTLPEIRNVARGWAPLFGTWTLPIVVDGKADQTLAGYASHSYFEMLGIPIVPGRTFTEQESREGARVAIISESTARHFWPAEDALSKRLKLDLASRGSLTEFEIIGIAKDVRFANPTRIDPARVYLPTNDAEISGVLVRIQGERETALAAVRKALEDVDASLLPYLQLRSLEEGPLAVVRFATSFFTYFVLLLAILTLTLAAVGIYGVMAFVVGQRTKEIGIRIALGAPARAVVRSIVTEGMPAVFVGALLGLAGAMAVSWLLHSRLTSPGSSDLLHGVPFYDPLVFLGLSGFVIGVAALASLVPARRALKVDPMIALRHE
jgi:putative ABC transport system permease protein